MSTLIQDVQIGLVCSGYADQGIVGKVMFSKVVAKAALSVLNRLHSSPFHMESEWKLPAGVASDSLRFP